jgi:hypothetical protein
MQESSWKSLLESIKLSNCTPFLGAGVNAGRLPLACTIARRWAASYDYPFEDVDNLQRVAQFLAGKRSPSYVKKMMLEALVPAAFVDNGKDDPLAILAALPFKIYMTTNYDSSMTDCLQHAGKAVRRERCYWYNRFAETSSVSMRHLPPSVQAPVVYHWHGNGDDVDSLVLTEDDYINFLVALARSRSLIPPLIAGAAAASCLLIVGYRLADINLHVILRSLDTTLRPFSIFVRYPESRQTLSDERACAQEEELTRYLGGGRVSIYDGCARDFAVELREKWHDFTGGRDGHWTNSER